MMTPGSAARQLSVLSMIMLRLTVRSFTPRQFTVRTASSCLFSSPSSSIDTPMKSNICIVGGGFGGLYTALKISSTLSEKDNVEITLIDPKDKFIFLPLLYELAIGGASVLEVAPKYETLLKGSKVKFIQSSVSDIDLNNNQVILADTTRFIKYDQLVISVGAQPRLDLVPGKNFFCFYHLKLFISFSDI
jgi:hypothetical protein